MIDPGAIPIFGKSRRSMERGNVVSKLCASILGMVCGDIVCYVFFCSGDPYLEKSGPILGNSSDFG